MHQAIMTARIFTFFPVIPVYPVPKFFPSFEVFLTDQVAGAFPAKGRARHIAPGRAGVVALAGGKLQEERSRTEPVFLRQREHLLKLLVNLLTEEEVIFLNGFVVVPRRN